MVLLSQLPLVQCSENIKTISISDSKRLCNKTKNSKDMTSYVQRHSTDESKTFAEFFQINTNNEDNTSDKMVIPHFVGLKSYPTYPVTIDYARATLIVNKPWRKHTSPHLLSDCQIIENFNNFIKSTTCPRSVKLSYFRAKTRYEEGRKYAECINIPEPDNDSVPPEEEDATLLHIINKLTNSNNSEIEILGATLDKGLTFDWGRKQNKVCTYYILT